METSEVIKNGTIGTLKLLGRTIFSLSKLSINLTIILPLKIFGVKVKFLRLLRLKKIDPKDMADYDDWRTLPIVIRETGELFWDYNKYLASEHFDKVGTDAWNLAVQQSVKEHQKKVEDSIAVISRIRRKDSKLKDYFIPQVKCPGCGGIITQKNHVRHHTTYEHIGDEQPGEVIIVCRKVCHNSRSTWHIKEHRNMEVPHYAKTSRTKGTVKQDQSV